MTLKNIFYKGPPEWYFNSPTKQFDLYTNLFFIIPALIAFQANLYILGIAIIIVMLASIWFHIKLTPESLYVDRLGMILAYAVIINIIYPTIPTILYFIFGLILLELSKKVNNQLPYILFQVITFFLIISNGQLLSKTWYFILLFVVGNVLQAFYVPYFHGLKHFLFAIALSGFIIYGLSQ
jgi:hypothetical protein